MTATQLLTNLGIIQSHLDSEVDTTNITLVETKLINLSHLMGLSAECMRWAKHQALTKQHEILSDPECKKMVPSFLKVYLEGEMVEQLTVLTYSDRINAAITHCSDNLRTVISKYKEELKINSYGGRVPDSQQK